MPELPEVQTTVDGLRTKVLKRTFVGVWSDWEKIIKKPQSFKTFTKQLQRKKIQKVWRRAKNVIIDLSDGYSLLIHQKMTGHLMVGNWILEGEKWKSKVRGPFDEQVNLFLHVIFFLDNGQMIALSDYRKFAKVELWKTSNLLNAPEFKNLGPEPLEKEFTLKVFAERIKNKKGRIKQVIMDPYVIAGVGNIYASEALWWAKIHPEKSALQLTKKELQLLYKAIQKVLQLGIKMGGESFADYRNVEGEKGNFGGKRRVYKRERQKCYRCGEAICRIMFGARSAFFCPRCQKL